MKAKIVRIGNSKGVRLPKALLEESRLEQEVELYAEPGRIVISGRARPRAGWAEAAKRMRERGDDKLLDAPTSTRFDRTEWRWR